MDIAEWLDSWPDGSQWAALVDDRGDCTIGGPL